MAKPCSRQLSFSLPVGGASLLQFDPSG